MSATPLVVQEATILQHCKVLHLPTVGGQCGALAAQAVRDRHTHLGYLEALLAAEVDERERHAIARRLKDARLPRVKTLDEFDFSQAPKVSATQLRELADGGYIARTEPVVLIGDCGTGKTHLLTGLCVAACRQKRRVRFTTAAALVNELVEAKHTMQLARVLARWARSPCLRSTGGSRPRWPTPAHHSNGTHDERQELPHAEAPRPRACLT